MQNKSYERPDLLKAPVTNVVIKVKDPILQAGGSYTSYLIAGADQLGAFQIRRRFNDFFFLREGLSKAWPGLYIPPIPEKKMTGNKEDKFIEDRKRFLEYFCHQVSRVSYLHYSEIFQQFIRNKSVLLENMVEQMDRRPSSERLAFYKEIFGDVQLGKEPIGEYKAKISGFSVYLKKSEKELEAMAEKVKDIAHAVRVFNNSLNICNTLVFPQYQKNVFSYYVDEDMKELPFLNDANLGERVRTYRDVSEVNAIDYIVDTIVLDHREVISLQQTIQQKEDLETKKKKLEEKRFSEQNQLTKLMSGKTTFKSIFSRGSKNDQMGILEKTVADDGREIESLDVLLNYITVILWREITKYKQEKQGQYVEMLAKVANMENEKLNIYGDLIRSLSMAGKSIRVE